jgi:electron transfer flavoprotein beta subunit
MIQDKLFIVVPVKYTAASTGPGTLALSPFDEYAVEEAVRIRERLGGKAVVTALSIGPAKSEEGLRDAISRGCDDAVLLTDPAFEGADTYATGYLLAQAIAKLSKERGPVDLAVFGKNTNDSDTGQVASSTAVQWGVPSVSFVKKVADVAPGKIVLNRMVEDGTETLEGPLPLAFSIVKEINEPRIPALKNKMSARKAVIPQWKAADLGAPAASLVSWGATAPVPARGGGETIEGGSAQEKAHNLLGKLKQRGLL